jgi:hypothetical protein
MGLKKPTNQPTLNPATIHQSGLYPFPPVFAPNHWRQWLVGLPGEHGQYRRLGFQAGLGRRGLLFQLCQISAVGEIPGWNAF